MKRRISISGCFRGNEDAEEALINLVTIGIARKDIQTIRSYSERLIQLRPNSQTALEGLATCAFADEDYEAAARYCEKLVETTPNHFERAFNLGVANQKLGRKEEAAKGLFGSDSHPPRRQTGARQSRHGPAGARRSERRS